MKRKWLAALLTAAMTAGVLSGCGGNGNAGTTTNETNTETPADSGENAEGGGVIRKKVLRMPESRQMLQM